MGGFTDVELRLTDDDDEAGPFLLSVLGWRVDDCEEVVGGEQLRVGQVEVLYCGGDKT